MLVGARMKSNRQRVDDCPGNGGNGGERHDSRPTPFKQNTGDPCSPRPLTGEEKEKTGGTGEGSTNLKKGRFQAHADRPAGKKGKNNRGEREKRNGGGDRNLPVVLSPFFMLSGRREAQLMREIRKRTHRGPRKGGRV